MSSRWRASVVRERVERLGRCIYQSEPLPGVRQDVRAAQHAQDPHADALGRASLPLQRLPQVLQPGGQPYGARENPLRRETLPLSDLRPPLLAKFFRHHSHEVCRCAAIPTLLTSMDWFGQLASNIQDKIQDNSTGIVPSYEGGKLLVMVARCRQRAQGRCRPRKRSTTAQVTYRVLQSWIAAWWDQTTHFT